MRCNRRDLLRCNARRDSVESLTGGVGVTRSNFEVLAEVGFNVGGRAGGATGSPFIAQVVGGIKGHRH